MKKKPISFLFRVCNRIRYDKNPLSVLFRGSFYFKNAASITNLTQETEFFKNKILLPHLNLLDARAITLESNLTDRPSLIRYKTTNFQKFNRLTKTCSIILAAGLMQLFLSEALALEKSDFVAVVKSNKKSALSAKGSHFAAKTNLKNISDCKLEGVSSSPHKLAKSQKCISQNLSQNSKDFGIDSLAQTTNNYAAKPINTSSSEPLNHQEPIEARAQSSFLSDSESIISDTPSLTQEADFSENKNLVNEPDFTSGEATQLKSKIQQKLNLNEYDAKSAKPDLSNLKASDNKTSSAIKSSNSSQILPQSKIEAAQSSKTYSNKASKSEIFNFKTNHRFVSDVSLFDNFKATNRQDKFLDSQLGARLYSNFQLTKNFEIYSYARLTRLDNDKTIAQRSSSVDGGGNRNFENLGIYLPEINLRNRYKNNLLILGKFTPDFGNGWRWDRGIWVQNIPSQYKQNEKIGIAEIYSIGDGKKTGLYDFAISFFTNSRGSIDNSLFAQRDSGSFELARAGGTNSPQSFNLSTNVSFDFGPEEKLAYHFSYLDLAVNKNATLVPKNKLAHQKGAAYGINYKYPVKHFLKLYSMIEYVEMKNMDGNSDILSRYLTASLGAKFFNRWTMMIGNANHKTQNLAALGSNETITEVNFGYDCPKTIFFDRFTAQIGYQKMRNDNKLYIDNRHALGLIIRYYKNF